MSGENVLVVQVTDASERAIHRVDVVLGQFMHTSIDDLPSAWGALVEAVISLDREFPERFYAEAESGMRLRSTGDYASLAASAQAFFFAFVAARTGYSDIRRFADGISRMRETLTRMVAHCPHRSRVEWTFDES